MAKHMEISCAGSALLLSITYVLIFRLYNNLCGVLKVALVHHNNLQLKGDYA